MKNTLITITVCLIAATIFLFSCQKENNDTTYYFKAKVDDNWITFKDARFFIGTDPSNPNTTWLQFYGGDQLNNLNISLRSANGITVGDYVSSDSLASYQLVLNLFKYNNDQYFQNFTSFFSSGNVHPMYTVTITSYGENEIKGKITGNYLYNASGGGMMNLTEAEFVAQKAN